MRNFYLTTLLLLLANTVVGQWDVMSVESYNSKPENFWITELNQYRNNYTGVKSITIFSPDDNSDTLTIVLNKNLKIKHLYGVLGDTVFVNENCVKLSDCACFSYYGQMDSVFCDSSGKILRHFAGNTLDEFWEYDSFGFITFHYIVTKQVESTPLIWKIEYQRDRLHRTKEILYYNSLENSNNSLNAILKLKQFDLQGVSKFYYTKTGRVKNVSFFIMKGNAPNQSKRISYIYKFGKLSSIEKYSFSSSKYPFKSNIIYNY